VDSTISQTSRLIALPERSGAVVSFAGKSTAGSPAIVVLKDVKGDFLPPGSIVKLAGSAEDIVVGYDGEAFFTTLKDNNEITVDTGSSSCIAMFAFQHKAPQPRLGPVVCR
jgi:outer membrane usher protein